MDETKESFDMLMYRTVFQRMLATGSPRIIQNDSTSHALILIEELLKSASRTVYVYCMKLDEKVWGSPGVLSALNEALSKGVQFYVMTREDVAEGNLAYKALQSRGCSVLKAKSPSAEENFVVVDERAFRLEVDTGDRKGFACANSPVNATTLIEIFKKMGGDAK